MDSDTRCKTLLSRGYFPKELPLTFTTEDFGSHHKEIISEWASSKLFSVENSFKVPGSKKSKRSAYRYKVKSAEYETLSTPKRGYERRNIHITHPIPQALLTQEICLHWDKIHRWVSRRQFSLDDVEISLSASRAIKGLNFEAHRAKKGFIEANSDWLIKTDITRFYPSIYTHSIPWAAYGKENVKSNLKIYDGSLADRLDSLVRACNRNQTVGVPIGPETSRILSEVISARIDDDFRRLMPQIKIDQIDRLQDDWFVGAPALEAAETVLSNIAASYREYGLDINGSKTAVARTTSPLDDTWIAEIGAFLSHRSGPIRSNRLRELLSLTLKLQLANPREPVVGYTLSVIEGQAAGAQDVEMLESFLMRAVTAAPLALNRICQMMINLQHDTKRVSKERVRSRFTTLAERNLANGNLYESVWLIYTLRGLSAPVRSKYICDAIETVPSSSLSLILLDMQNKGLCPLNLPKAEWASSITEERSLTDGSWLLAYEGIRHGWLTDPYALLRKPFFAPMANRSVVFYDPRRNVRPTKSVIKVRNNQRQRNRRAALRIITAIRGFSFGDYS